jgi:hypothetical protein
VGAVTALVKIFEGQNNDTRSFAPDAMVKYGAIGHSQIIIELTDSTETLLAAMVKRVAVSSIVNILESQNVNVQHSAADALRSMVDHCTISDSLIIIELTNSTQQTSVLQQLRLELSSQSSTCSRARMTMCEVWLCMF